MNIVTEYRRDRGTLLAPKMVGDILFVQGYACKPGILEYRNDDGTITRELVEASTLEESAAGLARQVLTLEHPRNDVDNTNWSELAVGDTDKDVVIEDNGYQRVTMAVRRRDAQQEVLNGKTRELSPGYKATIDKTPGEHPEYGRYDAKQIKRVYNHLAIVREARGGHSIAIRTDGEPELPAAELVNTIRGDSAVKPPTTGGESMPLSQAIKSQLALRGIDVTRIDSAEDALLAILMRKDMGPMQPPTQDMEQEDAGPDYPTNEDGSPKYLDDEGNPMTMDAYVEQLENDNQMMLEQLQGDAEEEAMDELEPMAQDMGVEVQKGDSAYALAHRMAGHLIGEELHPETSPDFIWGVIQKHRKDSGYEDRKDGRAAGREAYQVARRDSQTPANRHARQAVRDAHREDNGTRGGLGAIALRGYQDEFKRRKDAARGVIR